MNKWVSYEIIHPEKQAKTVSIELHVYTNTVITQQPHY